MLSIYGKHSRGAEGRTRESGLDIYPSDSPFLPTRPREAKDDHTHDFILLIPMELKLTVLRPMHLEEKQLTLGSSFKLETSL